MDMSLSKLRELARRGSQGASRAAPGKSGLHARGEGERVLALESREGTRASRRVEEGQTPGTGEQWLILLHKRRIPLAVVLPRPGRGAGTLLPSAQRFVWAAKQPLGSAAVGALFA